MGSAAVQTVPGVPGQHTALVYSLPEYTEVILLDFITVHCFRLYIQPLRKSEEDIIS